MNKRSAMAMAAGVVTALLAGAAAMSIGSSSLPTAQAGSSRTQPIVRTIRDTVTVHERATADRSGVVRVVGGPAQQPISVSAGSFDDDAYEDRDDRFDDERYDDDRSEDEDHEDEDHEDEDGDD